MRRLLCVLALALPASLPACGPTSTHGGGGPAEPAELRTLSEERALTLVREVLASESIPRGALWVVSIQPDTEIEVDVRLASSSFGIEWISPQDRADVGEAVPEPASGGQLRIVPGTGDDAGAQILILDHSAYEYANEREHVQRGVPGARETEERLRRDVRDYLHYVRGQGGL
ncbi:MAG TPA: hypothetical protein RMH99_24670 [Sandaracinaceae bacterium LLY-WYZ-13_1]|nr:hypothetical protein [Sandaracinaceae bacterium LLY-WYZ-13_1]